MDVKRCRKPGLSGGTGGARSSLLPSIVFIGEMMFQNILSEDGVTIV